nr:tetrahydromethanopterin S-methyltransferase subunit A [uncultured archaeon]
MEPGDYIVGNPRSRLAISTLSDEELMRTLYERLDRGSYAILGMTRTRNIGVEKLVRNVVANPHISRLVLMGRDSATAPVAPVLLELSRSGVAEDMSLRVQGRRMRLRNLTREEVEEFRRRVRIVDLSGVRDPEALIGVPGLLEDQPQRDSGEGPARAPPVSGYARVEAVDDPDVILDERGFFIIYVDRANGSIICEHYDGSGRKTAEVVGRSARAIYKTVIRMGLLSRLDHAAYLGRELARAECALSSGGEYVQDRA